MTVPDLADAKNNTVNATPLLSREPVAGFESVGCVEIALADSAAPG